MSELNRLCSKLKTGDPDQKAINAFYLALLKTDLYIPCFAINEKPSDDNSEPWHPLFIKQEDSYFITAFDNLDRLHSWANIELDGIEIVKMVGKTLFPRLTEHVQLSLFMGKDIHKVFAPDEIHHVQKIIQKINSLTLEVQKNN